MKTSRLCRIIEQIIQAYLSMIGSAIYTKSISANIIVIQWRTTIGTISVSSISLKLWITEVFLIGYFLQFSCNNFCCIKTV